MASIRYREHILILLLAMVFSSLTLWLVNSWVKYPLFIFEISIILYLFYTLSNYELRIIFSAATVRKMNFKLLVGYLLLIFSVILIGLKIVNLELDFIQLTITLLLSSLLSGYAIINLINIDEYFSTLEKCILSFFLSFTFTGILTACLLPVPSDYRIYAVLTGFGLLGFLALAKSHTNHTNRINPAGNLASFSKQIDVLAIGLTIIFFLLSIFSIYPGFASIATTDMSRQYASSILLWRTPALHINSGYFMANAHEAFLVEASNCQSSVLINSTLVFLTLILPLAFYVMAKPFLSKIDTRLPALSLIIWVLFTNGYGGFSWVYFSYLKINSPGLAQISLLTATAGKTYNGTIYAITGLWFVPLTISLILLMIGFFLLQKKDIPRPKYLALFAALIVALYLTHVIEAVIFTVFLSIYGLITKNSGLRIIDSLKASLLGYAFISVYYFVNSILTIRFSLTSDIILTIAGPVLFLLFTLIVRKIQQYKQISFLAFKLEIKLKVIIVCLIFIYFVALISWFSFIDSFNTSDFNTLGVVPWYVYPFILGITGLFGIVGIYFVVEKRGQYKSLYFFIAFLLFSFIAGTLVSVCNLNFFIVNYWEKRFLLFIQLSFAIIAPIPLLFSIDRIKRYFPNKCTQKYVLSIILIGTMTMYGVSTTFLNIDYWTLTTSDSSNLATPNEFSAINALKNLLDNDSSAWVLTLSDDSAASAALAGPADTLGLRQLVYTASSQEMFFTQLYRHSAYSHAYIYVAASDQSYISQSPILQLYLRMLPVVFSNSEVTIYNSASVSFPQISSDTLLVLPYSNIISSEDAFLATLMMSEGYYNYSTAYDVDKNVLACQSLLLSYDPPSSNTKVNSFDEDFSQMTSWANLKGEWTVANSQLVGGNDEADEGQILTNLSTQNFTMDVKISSLQGNSSVVNYASFIYSWTDTNNYKIADFVFDTDGYVYICFRNVVNGLETDSPTWPGYKTPLMWSMGDSYDLKLIVTGNNATASINGNSYSTTQPNSVGIIGLRYYRFNSISFDEFHVDYVTSFDMRPVTDYINYLQSGGTLTVINTNDDGFFYNQLFSTSKNSINATAIEANNSSLTLPVPLTIPALDLQSNSTILSSYIGSEGTTPFIVEKQYSDGGVLYFVNVNPIVSYLEECSNQSEFYDLLGHLFDALNITKMSATTPLSSYNGYVKDISLSGNATILTDSLIVSPDQLLSQIVINSGSIEKTYYNITNLFLSNYSNIFIKTDQVSTISGDGSYSVFDIKSPFSIATGSGNMTISFASSNSQITLTNIDSITINPGEPITIETRTPFISAYNVIFKELYLQTYNQLSDPVSGNDLAVSGLTSFNVQISDNYKTISNLTLGSSFKGIVPSTTYDVMSTLPTALFWCLLLLPIFIGLFLIYAILPSRKK